jgi:hypothetical protein
MPHVVLLLFGLPQLPCVPIELACPILNSISVIKQDMDDAARRDFLNGTRESLVLRLKPYHDTLTSDWDSPALLRWRKQLFRCRAQFDTSLVGFCRVRNVPGLAVRATALDVFHVARLDVLPNVEDLGLWLDRSA